MSCQSYCDVSCISFSWGIESDEEAALWDSTQLTIIGIDQLVVLYSGSVVGVT